MEAIEGSFSAGQQLLLNLILASMIFGLALDIKPVDFRRVLKAPKGPVIGVVAQFLLLPAVTGVLTLFTDLPAGIELGMILVAACPGGAISNFITFLARGNVALSISMTALSSLLAIFLLPVNFTFWAGLNPEASALLQVIEVDVASVFEALIIVLAVPLLFGQFVRHYWPIAAQTLHQLLKYTSVFILFAFIIMAVAQNAEAFASQFWLLLAVVFFHNAIALSLGYLSARLGGLPGTDRRAVMIEVGIQNSSLAIAIVFTQLGGEANMALIAAFWGTWHIVSGMVIAATCRFMSGGLGALQEERSLP